MSGGDWDELVAAAKQQLSEQEAEEAGAKAELGESVELEEEQAFAGRFRGYGKAFTRNGEREVILAWDADNARRFFWPKTRLQQELHDASPSVGDRLVIVRGHDKPPTDPTKNPMQRFAVRVERCDEPLPEEPSGDDGFPF